jgi:nucleoside-diphosphate-sugar epimerase
MKVFITGATGYIGGSVAEALVGNSFEVSGLARNKEKAEFLAGRGITAVLGELDDSEILAKAAAGADIIISAANSDHKASVGTILKAIVGTGKTFIHTSGSSIVADNAAGEPSDKIYDEETPIQPIPEKIARVDLDTIIKSAAKDDIRSIVICPTMIYGRGTGFHQSSNQIPMLIGQAKKDGAGRHIGRGSNRWSNVHISDLADLYLLALEKARPGDFFFAENGEEEIKTIAAEIGRLLEFEPRAQSWPLEDAEKEWGKGAALALSSNSRVRAVKARRDLGWQPKIDAVLASIKEEI